MEGGAGSRCGLGGTNGCMARAHLVEVRVDDCDIGADDLPVDLKFDAEIFFELVALVALM
jgi:hypothetical protein